MHYREDCLWFTGYKPCQFKRPCQGCSHYKPVQERIAILSLEAMGAVLRTTCILAPIKRKFPNAHITWITLSGAKPLLDHNSYIDRIITANGLNNVLLEHLKFDYLFALDKSLEAGALAERIQSQHKFGFGLTDTGVIRPFTSDAQYQFDLGLDDELKFYKNEKPETQQITESMALEWQRDPYELHLQTKETQEVADFRAQMLQPLSEPKGIIGFNTGCSKLYPNKKFTIEHSIRLISHLRKEFPRHAVALLGGPEDEQRQLEMKAHFSSDNGVINTPTRSGLRTGIKWMAATDLVISGCSLGMHIGIALKKPIVAWFGVSCIQEIDLYDKGIKLQSPVTCSPCWKKTCEQKIKCYDQVSASDIASSIKTLLNI